MKFQILLLQVHYTEYVLYLHVPVYSAKFVGKFLFTELNNLLFLNYFDTYIGETFAYFTPSQ